MYRLLIAATAVLVIGCLPKPTLAPSPLTFHAPKPATQATQIVAVALANAGFNVAQSGPAATALTANRSATHNGNQEYIWCRYPSGSDAAANRATTLFITFRAIADTTGSDVTIGGRVTTSYPCYQGTAMQISPNDTDCVSNGVIEQQLQSALR